MRFCAAAPKLAMVETEIRVCLLVRRSVLDFLVDGSTCVRRSVVKSSIVENSMNFW